MQQIVYLLERDLTNQPGLRRKIRGHLESFARQGYHPFILNTIPPYIQFIDMQENTFENIFYTSEYDSYKKKLDILNKLNPEIIYIRKNFRLNYFMMEFYKQLKETLKSRLIFEIPTINYEKDAPKESPLLLKIDLFYRDFLKQIFSISTNFECQTSVFEIPSIPIINAVDPTKIRQKQHRVKDDTIILISASSMHFWNGYERIIEGLYNYNKSKSNNYQFIIKLIGNGPATSEYKMLVKKYDLEQSIQFYPTTYGEELDQLFDESDIGLIAFGTYKIGIFQNNAIRSAEYTARGLPCIQSFENLTFNADYPYSLKVSNDPTPVNMHDIVQFYLDVYSDPQCNDKIRDYAIRYLNWDVQTARILEGLNSLK